MQSFFDWLLPTSFMPHGHCYLWRPDVLWLHVGSDSLIAVSYYAIPVAIAYFVRQRRAVLPYWWVPALFATFIFLCGTTHVLNIWTVWNPDYVVDGLLKLATGVASVATAAVVFSALPQALALRTPIELQREVDEHTAELRSVNTRLREEIAARERSESALRASEVELRQTVQRLADADRRKDVFLATLAHELRNPLAPIANGLQVMKLSARNEPSTSKVTAMMERQMQHLVRLVDDLLDLSRITRGKISLTRRRLSLQQVILEAIESTWTPEDRARLQLILQISQQPVEVDGDSDRLIQVFSNILANAAKYTPGNGKVWLTVQREAAEAVISVKDTGVGITPAALGSVFEMFSQAQTPRQGDGGLGIGLAIVRQLVQLHGGSVEARSDGVGHGSEFIVRLPALEPADAANTGSTPQAQAETGTPRRVLIVDDNQDAAESLNALLQLLGHQVRHVTDGAAAVACVQMFAPELVFMDIGMPRMNGFEATEHIRRLPLARQPMICALTGWGQESDRQRSRAAGIDQHLVKPIDYDALLNVLEQAGTSH